MLKFFAGSSNTALAREVTEALGCHLGKVSLCRFNDGEIFVDILESVRGADIFVLQSTSHPTNDHLMELLIMIDALRRGCARRIIACIPYFGYARQDRKTGMRSSISAKLVANLITKAGADHMVSFDLHTGQIQGFFDIPVDNLYVMPLFCQDITQRHNKLYPNHLLSEAVIVAPDVGGVVRARSVAKNVSCQLAIVDKRRDGPNQSQVMHLIGDVKGRVCYLIDDIVDSAGTLVQAAHALYEAGAFAVSAYASHGVLSKGALERVENSSLKELVVTTSIAPCESLLTSRLRYISLAGLLAESIKRIYNEESVASLFEGALI